MTVKTLIRHLSKCDPNAVILIEDSPGSRMLVTIAGVDATDGDMVELVPSSLNPWITEGNFAKHKISRKVWR
jgi:hypothetical protein